MSTKCASSPSDNSSSGTCHEIVPVGDTNHTSSNNPTHKVNNKEIDKPPTGVVADHPKPKRHSSIETNLFGHKNAKPKSIDNKPTTTTTTTTTDIEPRTNDGDNNRSHSETEALSKLIDVYLNSVSKSYERISGYEERVKLVHERFKMLKEGSGSADEYRELKTIAKTLKKGISLKNKDDPDESYAVRHLWSYDSTSIIGANADMALDEMPILYKNPIFEQSLEFKEFVARFHELKTELKLCLLCFSVFPENVEIKKKAMIYWWIGEGFVPPVGRRENQKTPEQFANEFFNKLITEGFIEPMYAKRNLGVKICKVRPFVRNMLIALAKRANFFDFDNEGNAHEDYSYSLRSCLTGKGLTNIQDLEKLHTLFNVNETFLEFNPEWFSRMKNVNVLYLGRWQTSPLHHIEVEDIDSMRIKHVNILDGLENVTHLRFLSLQGISRVTELPESISQLTSLIILDIRACHNLEAIPDGIGSLKNLTHLDMAECYLLVQMPKGLASLSKLQVLSGFVFRDSKGENSCTLDDLVEFPELRKLSIHTSVDNFPSDKDLRALNQLKALTKLTIVWGRGSVLATRQYEKKFTRAVSKKKPTGILDRENVEVGKKKEISAVDQAAATSKKLGPTKTMRRLTTSKFAELLNPELPSQLIKLDLQCFPGMITPYWLKACKLNSLKKLYIRGGKFSDLGQFKELDDEELEKDKWKVEELRLKYLTDLEMNWRELQELFPNLTYLEKVNCPKLTFFPCDESGVWMNKTMGG
ncbi:unnamed protein product [Camellia sinensis]